MESGVLIQNLLSSLAHIYQVTVQVQQGGEKNLQIVQCMPLSADRGKHKNYKHI